MPIIMTLILSMIFCILNIFIIQFFTALFNQEKYLKGFKNPNCKVEIDGKEFTMRFTDEYTFKMVLEEIEKEGEPHS